MKSTSCSLHSSYVVVWLAPSEGAIKPSYHGLWMPHRMPEHRSLLATKKWQFLHAWRVIVAWLLGRHAPVTVLHQHPSPSASWHNSATVALKPDSVWKRHAWLFQYLSTVIIFTAVYIASSKVGLLISTVNNAYAAIWPPTGISIAALLLIGYSLIPGVFLGAFLATVTTGDVGVGTSILIALGNTLEALVAVYLVNRYAGGRFAFENVSTIFRFGLLAVMLAPITSALVGVLALHVAGTIPAESMLHSGFTWWLTNASSALVITPLMLAWANHPEAYYTRREMFEISVAIVTISTVIVTVFSPNYNSYFFGPMLVVGSVPVMAWIAMRFTLREVAAAMVIFTGIALSGTIRGFGPVAAYSLSLSDAIFQLQMYLIAISFTFYLLTVVVAEQRRVEESLRVLNKTKDEFLAAAAHELRNPLAPMVSYMDLLRVPALSELDRQVALEGMRHGLDRLTGLFDDLLDLARFSAGKIRLERREVDLCTLLQDAARSVELLGKHSGHTLTVEFKDQPLILFADPNRVVQVFVNLLNNAIKYTERGGVIRVIAGLSLTGDRVIVRVRDTGIGIESEELASIFNMFSQSNNQHALERSNGGLGIGLRLVKVFTEMHGGMVEARSRGAGKGSEFRGIFPLAPNRPIL